MESRCFNCSRNGTSCCQGTQICLTTGDVLRISQFLGWDNFFAMEVADRAYLDPGNDPVWITLTIRTDGRRRVLKRTADRSCSMLGGNGCLLPLIVRPLVCRLHPYTFTEAGISGVDPACPISQESNWPSLLNQLGMAMGDARNWHRLLYYELHGDEMDRPEGDRRGLPSEPVKLSA